MLLRILGAGSLLLLLPIMAAAQQKTVDQLDSEVQQLKKQLESVVSDLKKLDTDVQESANTLTENSKTLGAVLEQLSDLNSAVQDLSKRQEQAIGDTALRLNNNMQSEEYRYEMRKAVHDSLRQEGSVIISNKMTTSQRIWINQKEHEVAAGETLRLSVPVGTLTAQLSGQQLTNWTITAPNYEQKIDIVPTTSVKALRPVESKSVTALRPLETTVTTLSPVVSSLPVYVEPVTPTYYVDPYGNYWYWPY